MAFSLQSLTVCVWGIADPQPRPSDTTACLQDVKVRHFQTPLSGQWGTANSWQQQWQLPARRKQRQLLAISGTGHALNQLGKQYSTAFYSLGLSSLSGLLDQMVSHIKAGINLIQS